MLKSNLMQCCVCWSAIDWLIYQGHAYVCASMCVCVRQYVYVCAYNCVGVFVGPCVAYSLLAQQPIICVIELADYLCRLCANKKAVIADMPLI